MITAIQKISTLALLLAFAFSAQAVSTVEHFSLAPQQVYEKRFSNNTRSVYFPMAIESTADSGEVIVIVHGTSADVKYTLRPGRMVSTSIHDGGRVEWINTDHTKRADITLSYQAQPWN